MVISFSKMSVEELHAHIVRLDTEIDLQKELLKKLEHDRSLVQRQLNAALDPVARLPVEISSEIFLYGTQPAAVLMNICHAWSEIALATPTLWMSLRIDFPCAEDLVEALPVWFQRARNRPLSLTITLCGRSSNWNHRVSSLIWCHGAQLKHLEILDDDDFGDESEESLDLLGPTTSLSLSSLETLTMRCERQQRDYLASHIVELLRQAPNIVECIFDNIRTLDNFPDSDYLIVPTLRRVNFGDRHTGEPDILHRLSLPALETLVIPISSVFYEEHLLALIQRSAPPLQYGLPEGHGWISDPIVR
ncbi:hypothetical protein C8R45DRAFT_1068621 [Mycena sanguinolenta]|nr:hypothetical protein C8R45DRAFT_1068621 [Mycena sanguinolenta]